MKEGKADDALRVVDEALVQAEAQGSPAAVAPVLVLRMGIQTAQRDFPGAEASAIRGFELAEKIQVLSPTLYCISPPGSGRIG
jgi:hypothetical protein